MQCSNRPPPVPLEIKRNGKILVIAPKEEQSIWDRLPRREGFIVGDPDELIHFDWSSEWTLILLDTHVVGWLYAGLSERIPEPTRVLIDERESKVSPLVALELAYLHEVGRTRDPVPMMMAAAPERGLGDRRRLARRTRADGGESRVDPQPVRPAEVRTRDRR